VAITMSSRAVAAASVTGQRPTACWSLPACGKFRKIALTGMSLVIVSGLSVWAWLSVVSAVVC
jgi:hypothetical protein